MHRDRIAPPAFDTPAFIAQRVVMLELLIDPPAGGDHVPDLARRLGEPSAVVREALAALERAGLVVRLAHDHVRPIDELLYLEALCPLAI